MRKRYMIGSGLAMLAILLTLIVWQVSFSFGDYGPANTAQTFVFWAVSTLIFLLTVTVGFMLFREGVKLYIARQGNREGSRIKSKLVFGALALSLLPVVFLVMFSYVILNHNMDKWFSLPAAGVRTNLLDTAEGLNVEVQDRAQALAYWFASMPEVHSGAADFAKLCVENRVAELRIQDPGGTAQTVCSAGDSSTRPITAEAPLGDGRSIAVSVRPGINLQETEKDIKRYMSEYNQLASQKRSIRNLYLLFLLLIALFILFVATWIALMLARQISVPISALLVAAGEVRKGNLGHRVQVTAIDELATLVRAFNEMMHELEANSRELESRRRFTEAILESIPTGVISLAADGRIQRVNRALHGLFAEDQIARAAHLGDLFPRQDVAEIEYLMKRARRTGVAASQIDIESPRQVLHLAVTVSALPGRQPAAPAFVVVLEDTSELLRAQKAAAWHEVARRIAHELKNPLTPIALCAERIARQLDRGASSPESQRISARLLSHDFARSGIGQNAGRRILAILAIPGRAAGPLRSERHRPQRPGGFRGTAGWDRSARGSGPESAAGACRSGAVQTRGGESGGQRRGSDARFAGEAVVGANAGILQRIGGIAGGGYRLRHLRRG